jgi:hypothetical protein
MSKTKSFAERELDILVKTTPDAVIRDFIHEIIALCEAFGNSGQSGGSAPYVAKALSQAVKNLCLQRPISPLTGEENEWMEITDNQYQNKRLSSVFKKYGKAYYLDAISWKTKSGSNWSGTAKTKNGEEISSRQYIKSFPFKAQEFVIDVTEIEISKDNFEFIINNEKDLDKVLEVYDKFTK